mgnify:CR=1 FL=1
MSQHICHTTHQGRPVTVMLGWDRPLQEFFLTVELVGASAEGAKSEEDLIIYSTMYDHSGKWAYLDYLKEKLASLEIDVPKTMFTEVQTDQRIGGGNRVAIHTETGFTG